ncbi:MAG: HlyC/CorC family transporter, partial [Thermotogaceae bacterium]|nr:HlyC/CorC family transporter [Thermotogaceae bacterium]
PIVKFLEILTSLMMKLFGSKKERMLTEEELKTVVTMGHEEGILSKEVADMMDSLVEFGEKDVDEIMTLKDEIAFVDGNLKLKDVVDYIVKTPFSRYPVYVKTKDNIVGILDVDDVLKYIKENKLNVKVKNISREVYFVPETKDIDDLLVEFQRKETPMAMVVDEYGSVVGMVTMEDILEEIVGDIFDKSMRREFYITHVNKNTIRADARARIDQIERTLGIELKEGDFNTIAGLIEHKLGRIPKKGEKIDLGKFYIIVEKATRKRIEKVKIVKK